MILLEMLLIIIYDFYKIDITILKSEMNIYDKLELDYDVSYIDLKRKIIQMVKTQNSEVLEINKLIGSEEKKNKYDEHYTIINTFCSALSFFILKIMENIINSELFYEGLYPYNVNNIIYIVKEYKQYLCIETIIQNRLLFYLNILEDLKLINDNSDQNQEEVYTRIKQECIKHPQYIRVDKIILSCDALISKTRLTNPLDPNWMKLMIEFQENCKKLHIEN
jgi:hypothetical protein